MRLDRGSVVGELEARGLAGAAIHADVERLEVVLRALEGAHPALAAFPAHDAGNLTDDKYELRMRSIAKSLNKLHHFHCVMRALQLCIVGFYYS